MAAVVFMVGGVFFTTGGYASVLQVANAPREVDGVVQASAWRWWSTEPGRLDWASAVAGLEKVRMLKVTIPVSWCGRHGRVS